MSKFDHAKIVPITNPGFFFATFALWVLLSITRKSTFTDYRKDITELSLKTQDSVFYTWRL